jgi:hypothetical protein
MTKVVIYQITDETGSKVNATWDMNEEIALIMPKLGDILTFGYKGEPRRFKVIEVEDQQPRGDVFSKSIVVLELTEDQIATKCGRYYRRSDKQRIAEAFKLGKLPEGFVLPDWDYNVAPTTFQPVIRHNKQTVARELRLMRCVHFLLMR